MKCGHRGKPNKSEEKLLDNLMRNSDFITPLLQDRSHSDILAPLGSVDYIDEENLKQKLHLYNSDGRIKE